MKKQTFYPLGDKRTILPNHRAIKTGEFRNVLKGEWYLSGAPGEAYQALNNLSHPYHIAMIVETELISYRIIKGEK